MWQTDRLTDGRNCRSACNASIAARYKNLIQHYRGFASKISDRQWVFFCTVPATNCPPSVDLETITDLHYLTSLLLPACRYHLNTTSRVAVGVAYVLRGYFQASMRDFLTFRRTYRKVTAISVSEEATLSIKMRENPWAVKAQPRNLLGRELAALPKPWPLYLLAWKGILPKP